MAIAIRAASLPADKPAILSFIDGIQHFENPFEPDRRVDGGVAEEYFAQIAKKLDGAGTAALIAEEDGVPLGWGLVSRETSAVYVVQSERDHAQISELFVTEAARGKGVGRALIAACEDWARSQGLHVVLIGVLPGNVRAERTYLANGFTPYAHYLRKYLT